MFLPGRSIQNEKEKRKQLYTSIEQLCLSLIESTTIKEIIIISVQEVVCGDPQCSPIDTMITLSFPSGGQGMLALPMEPQQITLEILRDNFPPNDILQKWMNGEDVEWPPMYNDDDDIDDDDNNNNGVPIELRFQVGTAVICRIGPDVWSPGIITQLWYRENTWPNGAYAPYQILLNDQRKIFAPFDNDSVIRLLQTTDDSTSSDNNNNNNVETTVSGSSEIPEHQS